MIRELKFKLLTRRYADEIYRFSRGMLGDPTEAEDATQEVFLRFWQNTKPVPLKQSRAWLYRAARNHCIDLIRRRKTARQPVYVDESALHGIADDSPAPFGQQHDHAHLHDQLDRALNQLPNVQRSVFVLYEINELPYRQIADTLEIPINSVKVYLSRARKQLQHRLKDQRTWTTT